MYELYGLTEEETAIVEGTVPPNTVKPLFPLTLRSVL